MPWLVPRSEDLDTQTFDQRLVVGREGDVGLLIRDPAVSRIHCVLQQVRDGSWKIHDPGSRNGTFVNGRRVEKIVTLRDGDILGIGSPREQNAWEFRLSQPASKHEAERKVDSLVMTRSDMPAVAEFAPQENVENTDVLRRDYERLRGAWQLMQRLAGHTSQETLLENALDAMIDMFQAERGAAMLRDTHGCYAEPPSAHAQAKPRWSRTLCSAKFWRTARPSSAAMRSPTNASPNRTPSWRPACAPPWQRP